MPVYTADNNTYYAYTVEEAPIAGYSSEIFYDETDSTAKIVNTPQSFEIVLSITTATSWTEDLRVSGLMKPFTLFL